MATARFARLIIDPLYCFPGCGKWVKTALEFGGFFKPAGEGSGQLATTEGKGDVSRVMHLGDCRPLEMSESEGKAFCCAGVWGGQDV
jgi:hypothetical protein